MDEPINCFACDGRGCEACAGFGLVSNRCGGRLAKKPKPRGGTPIQQYTCRKQSCGHEMSERRGTRKKT